MRPISALIFLLIAAPAFATSYLQKTILAEGDGASPSPTSVVSVHYRGTLSDGREFDSSYKRGQPASFELNQVIPCWQAGVAAMRVGEKAKLVCPPETAYGERGVPGVIPPNSTLNFEVELLDIVE